MMEEKGKRPELVRDGRAVLLWLMLSEIVCLACDRVDTRDRGTVLVKEGAIGACDGCRIPAERSSCRSLPSFC